jgi:hypothetical protein
MADKVDELDIMPLSKAALKTKKRAAEVAEEERAAKQQALSIKEATTPGNAEDVDEKEFIARVRALHDEAPSVVGPSMAPSGAAADADDALQRLLKSS